jgi:hypothetical protein
VLADGFTWNGKTHVRLGPVSGEEGQRNGTPCPNAFEVEDIHSRMRASIWTPGPKPLPRRSLD